MTIADERETDARAEAIERLRKLGKPVLTRAQLYGPGPGPDDPEDLEAFLAFLAEHRRSAHDPEKLEGE